MSSYTNLALGTIQYDIAPIGIAILSGFGLYWYFTSTMNESVPAALKFKRCQACYDAFATDWNDNTPDTPIPTSTLGEAWAARRAFVCFGRYGCKYDSTAAEQSYGASLCGNTSTSGICGSYDLASNSALKNNPQLLLTAINACNDCVRQTGQYMVPLESFLSFRTECKACSLDYENESSPGFRDCCS